LVDLDVLIGFLCCMPCNQWADGSNNVGNTSWKRLFHKFTRSFRTMVLLASSEDQSRAGFAIVDTGASLATTP
jgi:hypothetical protein